MALCSDRVPPELLWPILEKLPGPPSQKQYILQEMPEYINIDTCRPGNPNFPYHPEGTAYNNALSHGSLNLTNSRFWTSFSHCHKAFFVDKYMGENRSWKLICSKLDFLERQKSRKPEMITAFVDAHDIDNMKSEFWEKITALRINKVSIDILAIPEYVHDRFALFDFELWHCGASAAGSHHKLNAISGPWPDKKRRFRKFLNNEIRNAHL